MAIRAKRKSIAFVPLALETTLKGFENKISSPFIENPGGNIMLLIKGTGMLQFVSNQDTVLQ